jgi:hypothetical protein
MLFRGKEPVFDEEIELADGRVLNAVICLV